jgi:hypothetical protein
MDDAFMLIIALLIGVASLFNYWGWANYELSETLKVASIAGQFILALVTVFTAARYRGKRLRRSYDGAGYKIFTISYGLIFLSALGNIAVLIVLVLRMIGMVQTL